MARIAISMSGEGRGHATRVRALAEALRAEHELTLYAPGDAQPLLGAAFADTAVRVRPLPCLRFAYRADARLDYLATGRASLGYLRKLPRLVLDLADELRALRTELVVSDFEPALPLAARLVGLPVLSLTHQRVLLTADLAELPARLRLSARWMGCFVRALTAGADRVLVSSFYDPPRRRGAREVPHVGVLLRPEVRAAKPRRGAHVLAYFRRDVPPAVLRTLQSAGREVRVYGAGRSGTEGALRHRALGEQGFVRDLASCHALVCTAGNQLVGEALHLRKPVLALPEPGNHEQAINAHFLERSGRGRALAMQDFDERRLAEFLGECERLRARASPRGARERAAARAAIPGDGTSAAVAQVEALLRGTRARTPERRPLHAVPA